ncbi:MAG: hypothetical protein WAX69_02315 [Victivallales bacterium]
MRNVLVICIALGLFGLNEGCSKVSIEKKSDFTKLADKFIGELQPALDSGYNTIIDPAKEKPTKISAKYSIDMQNSGASEYPYVGIIHLKYNHEWYMEPSSVKINVGGKITESVSEGKWCSSELSCDVSFVFMNNKWVIKSSLSSIPGDKTSVPKPVEFDPGMLQSQENKTFEDALVTAWRKVSL